MRFRGGGLRDLVGEGTAVSRMYLSRFSRQPRMAACCRLFRAGGFRVMLSSSMRG